MSRTCTKGERTMGLSSRKMRQLSAAYLALVFLFGGCQISAKKDESDRSQNENTPLVDEKYSLTADRKELDELRKNIPEAKKKENDELAFMAEFFADPAKNPSDIRAKFDNLLRKKRDLFQKDMTKEREAYVKEERKRREAITKELDDARNDFQR